MRHAFDKYGFDNFVIEILCSARCLEDLNYLETFFINKYNCLSPVGYNLNYGGGNRTILPSTRDKISKANKGQIPWCKGKKLKPTSDITKERMRKCKLGIKTLLSKEAREKQLSGIRKFTYEKRTPIVGIHKITGEELYFDSQCAAAKVGFIQSELSKCTINPYGYYSHRGYFWKKLRNKKSIA